MRQSAPGNDQRIDLVVGQSGTTKLIDGICGQTVLHKPDEVLVRAQPVHTEKLLDTLEEIRLLGLVSDGRLRQWRSSRSASCSLLYGNLLRARNRQRYQRYPNSTRLSWRVAKRARRVRCALGQVRSELLIAAPTIAD